MGGRGFSQLHAFSQYHATMQSQVQGSSATVASLGTQRRPAGSSLRPATSLGTQSGALGSRPSSTPPPLTWSQQEDYQQLLGPRTTQTMELPRQPTPPAARPASAPLANHTAFKQSSAVLLRQPAAPAAQQQQLQLQQQQQQAADEAYCFAASQKDQLAIVPHAGRTLSQEVDERLNTAVVTREVTSRIAGVQRELAGHTARLDVVSETCSSVMDAVGQLSELVRQSLAERRAPLLHSVESQTDEAPIQPSTVACRQLVTTGVQTSTPHVSPAATGAAAAPRATGAHARGAAMPPFDGGHFYHEEPVRHDQDAAHLQPAYYDGSPDYDERVVRRKRTSGSSTLVVTKRTVVEESGGGRRSVARKQEVQQEVYVQEQEMEEEVLETRHVRRNLEPTATHVHGVQPPQQQQPLQPHPQQRAQQQQQLKQRPQHQKQQLLQQQNKQQQRRHVGVHESGDSSEGSDWLPEGKPRHRGAAPQQQQQQQLPPEHRQGKGANVSHVGGTATVVAAAAAAGVAAPRRRTERSQPGRLPHRVAAPSDQRFPERAQSPPSSLYDDGVDHVKAPAAQPVTRAGRPAAAAVHLVSGTSAARATGTLAAGRSSAQDAAAVANERRPYSQHVRAVPAKLADAETSLPPPAKSHAAAAAAQRKAPPPPSPSPVAPPVARKPASRLSSLRAASMPAQSVAGGFVSSLFDGSAADGPAGGLSSGNADAHGGSAAASAIDSGELKRMVAEKMRKHRSKQMRAVLAAQ